MVTVLGPTNRRVSIWAVSTVDWPGGITAVGIEATVQPQETRRLCTFTVLSVLFVRRNGCDSIDPCGTVPKSRCSSSNRPSAQPADAGAARQKPVSNAKLVRNIVGPSLKPGSAGDGVKLGGRPPPPTT